MDLNGTDWTNLSDGTNLVRVIGLFLSLVTAIVTKKMASSGLKSAVTTALAALTGSVVYLLGEDGALDWTGFVNGFVNAYVPAIALYYGLLKPTGIVGAVAEKTKGFGVGKPVLETEDKGAEAPYAPAEGRPAPDGH